MQLDEKIIELSKYFLTDYKEDESQENIGLLTGRTGTIFVQSCIYELTKDKSILSQINENIDFIINDIINSERVETAYSAGVCGFAYTLNLVKPILSNQIEIDEILDEIDETLENELDYYVNQNNFDLIHGAIGTALYLLERNKDEFAKKIIHELDLIKIVENNEIKWSRYDPYNLHTDIYDFGFAHGMASYMYFFLKCYQKEILKNKCEELILELINLYDKNYSKETQSFPAIIKRTDYPLKESHSTRLAWCYGDLTILNTLLMVSKTFENFELYEKVIKKLEVTCLRKDKEVTFIVDSGFCHGTSGLATIYDNIYDITKMTVFKDASDYWLNKTLEYSNNKNFICGYSFQKEKDVFGSDITMLSGISGIVSSLISTKNEISKHNLRKIFFII